MKVSVFTDELFIDAQVAMPIIASWGCKTVDFRGHINGKGIEYQTDEELRALKAQMEELGLRAGVLQSSLLKVHLPDKERLDQELEKLEGLIRASNILGTKLVRSFFGWQPGREDFGTLVIRPDVFQQVMDLFAPFAKRAKEAGLILGFENCGISAQEVIAVLDALGVPEWGMAWDVSNHWESVPNIDDQDKQTEYILTCLRRSNMVHVKSRGILGELGGTMIDWPRILRGVQALGVDDLPVSIETHNPKDSPFTNEEATKKSYEAIMASMPTAASGGLEEAISVRASFSRSYADNPVRFVVVGMGMGRFRAGQIAKASGCELYGIVDINEEKARSAGEYFGVPWSADIQKFLDDPRVEVMYIVTPTGLHCEIAIQCMRAGKHVLTTKPMDRCAEACAEAIAEAKKCGVLFGIDFDQRYRNPWVSLVEANKRGYFGRVLSATVQLKIKRPQSYYDENGAWRGTKRYDGGGAMSNQGIHEIDRLIWVLGMPKRVTGYTATQAHVIEAEDIGFGAWEYENGMLVNFYSTTNYPADTWYSRVEIHGTAGAFIAESGGANPAIATWFKDGKWSFVAPYPMNAGYAHGADNFASVIRMGTPLECSGEEGIKSRAVLDAMYRSADKGGEWTDVMMPGKC